MEDTLVTRNADIEAELADGIAAIDDLKTTCMNIETSILNINKENINVGTKTSGHINCV